MKVRPCCTGAPCSIGACPKVHTTGTAPLTPTAAVKIFTALTQRFPLSLTKLFLSVNNPLVCHPCHMKEFSKAWVHIQYLTSCGSSLVIPRALGVHFSMFTASRVLQELRGQQKGYFTQFGLSRRVEGTWESSRCPYLAQTKAKVEANPDLNFCASCLPAPFSCPINCSSIHLTVIVHFKNIRLSLAENNMGSIQVTDSPLQRDSLEEHNYRKTYWLV